MRIKKRSIQIDTFVHNHFLTLIIFVLTCIMFNFFFFGGFVLIFLFCLLFCSPLEMAKERGYEKLLVTMKRFVCLRRCARSGATPPACCLLLDERVAAGGAFSSCSWGCSALAAVRLTLCLWLPSGGLGPSRGSLTSCRRLCRLVSQRPP